MTYNVDGYINLIKTRLSEYRFHHSVCVAESAVALAKRFGADEEKARVAGILHDVMKEASLEEHLAECEKAGVQMSELELKNKKLHHQISGAAFVKCELGIEDEDIINAIRFHTTARENMSLLEQIIYLADYISDDRDYEDVDVMRRKVSQGLESGMLYAMRYTIVDLANHARPIHPDTVSAYNWVINNFVKED